MTARVASGLLRLSRSTTCQVFGAIVPRVYGPSPHVPEILQTLGSRHVHATFFLIGAQIAEAGQDVGNHSGSHARMAFKTPPFGKKLLGLPWYLAQHHRNTITWDVDPLSDREVDRVDGLQARGYRLVTINEMLAYR